MAVQPMAKDPAISKNKHKRSNDKMAQVWGILSDEDREAGFELLLNDEWQLFLVNNGKVLAHFDPIEYTLRELTGEVKMLVRTMRANSFWTAFISTPVIPLPSSFEKLHRSKQGNSTRIRKVKV